MQCIRSAWTLSFLFFAACSAPAPASTAGDGGFAAEPLANATSDSGGYTVAIRTAPDQPPTRGTSIVELSIRSASTGEPLDGLSIGVVPWMPAMGHGSSVVPTVTPGGQGTYVVSNVSLYMPGRWELRTSISGMTNDSITFAFDIP